MKLSRRAWMRLTVLGALGAGFGVGFHNSRSPELKEVPITLKRLPPAFAGLKIAQISDIHSGKLVPRSLIEEGVDLALGTRPDVILVTGDFIAAATQSALGDIGEFDPRHLSVCLEQLSRLEAPLGVYGVLGNHDFWSGKEAIKLIAEGLNRIGVRLLRNESLFLERDGQKLYLAGVDDYWESSYDLKKAVKGLPPEECVILLSHNPDVNEDVETLDQSIDLIVSGHTHGGQIVLPVIGAPYLPSASGQKYREGLVRDGERQTYINVGLGVFFVPVRLNCPAEVTLMTLRRG